MQDQPNDREHHAEEANDGGPNGAAIKDWTFTNGDGCADEDDEAEKL